MSPTALSDVVAADDPAAWARLGFAIDATGAVALGGVTVRLEPAAAGRGLVALALTGAAASRADLDGIPLRAPGPRAAAGAGHPNGALAVDHVVVSTPALGRTLAALRAVGLEVRRTREVPGDRPLRQAFVVAGPCLLEVVGPPAGGDDARPATLWGLTVVVADVDALARDLGGLLGTPRDAVQPGRRIVTARRATGSAVRLAFMTPRPPREDLRVERT